MPAKSPEEGDGKDPDEKGPFGDFSPLWMAEAPILSLSLLSFALENAIAKSFAK